MKKLLLTLIAALGLTTTAQAQSITATVTANPSLNKGITDALAVANAAIDAQNNTRTNAAPALPALPNLTRQQFLNQRFRQVLQSYARQAAAKRRAAAEAEDEAFLDEYADATEAKREAARAAARAALR